MKDLPVIKPNWPAPFNIQAFTTTRVGGVSKPPYDNFNLALHVGDDAQHVIENRKLLRQTFHLPAEPIWLEQVHGTDIFFANHENEFNNPPIADATIATIPHQICVVMTADCLPILICNKQGTEVSAIHAGWKGLLSGVIHNTITNMKSEPSDLMVWFGPGIRQHNFQVGSDVRDLFMKKNHSFEQAFIPQYDDKWLADLYLLATLELQKLGIQHIYDCGLCTFENSQQFFSYRRDNTTGRIATLIWME